MGIRIGGKISEIAGIPDEDALDPLNPDLSAIPTDFPVLSAPSAKRMREAIAQARAEGDSVGGVVECWITGLPAGLGEPMFGGVESRIAQIVYGIPAVKALEFGAGRAVSAMRGSQCNDPFTIEKGQVRTLTNNAGGILGGITNGMPVVFRTTFKPTPSISRPQRSISLSRGEDTELIVKGRHDPCIVPRAVPVVEAAAAIAVYDLILSNTQTSRRKETWI